MPFIVNNGNNVNQGSGSTQYGFAYDAWNRLVLVDSLVQPVNGNRTIEHDALGRKIVERTTHMYYSNDWQVILEQTPPQMQGGGGGSSRPGPDGGVAARCARGS